MRPIPSILLFILAALLSPAFSFADNLDDAPFRIVIPNAAWKLQSNGGLPSGEGLSVVARIGHGNGDGFPRLTVLKADLSAASPLTFADLRKMIHVTLTNQPGIKMMDEFETRFVGCRAVRFVYYLPDGNRMLYNECVAFLDEHAGWTVSCTGLDDQVREVQSLFGFCMRRSGH